MCAELCPGLQGHRAEQEDTPNPMTPPHTGPSTGKVFGLNKTFFTSTELWVPWDPRMSLTWPWTVELGD